MELAMANGFSEMPQNEMMEVDGGGLVAAIALGGLSVLAGAAVIAYTPFKKRGVQVIVSGLSAATGLYFVEEVE